MGLVYKGKGDFMKNSKFKRVYLLELAIAVTISLGVGSILGMKVFSHLYRLSGVNSKSIMKVHNRIDFLEDHIRKHCPSSKEVKPVGL